METTIMQGLHVSFPIVNIKDSGLAPPIKFQKSLGLRVFITGSFFLEHKVTLGKARDRGVAWGLGCKSPAFMFPSLELSI